MALSERTSRANLMFLGVAVQILVDTTGAQVGLHFDVHTDQHLCGGLEMAS